MKHVMIRLDDERHRALKVLVGQKGTTLQRALETAIERYLEEEHGGPRSTLKPKNLRGLLADFDVMGDMERDREQELEQDARWLNDKP